jgi:hypothetical protein
MSLYLVRAAETRAIVGIFYAHDRMSLAEIVDDSGENPNICEVAELPEGGISFRVNTPIPLPSLKMNEGEIDRAHSQIWGSAEAYSEQWGLMFLEEHSQLQWGNLVPDGMEYTCTFLHKFIPSGSMDPGLRSWLEDIGLNHKLQNKTSGEVIPLRANIESAEAV